MVESVNEFVLHIKSIAKNAVKTKCMHVISGPEIEKRKFWSQMSKPLKNLDVKAFASMFQYFFDQAKPSGA